MHDSVLLCRDISKCEIDKSSIILKEELKPVPLSYVAVKPEKYTDFVQDDLFGTGNNEAVTPYLLGKSFVVFDFETTGTDVTDEVTELGAVKIVDGIITETLSLTSSINNFAVAKQSFTALCAPSRLIPKCAHKVPSL